MRRDFENKRKRQKDGVKNLKRNVRWKPKDFRKKSVSEKKTSNVIWSLILINRKHKSEMLSFYTIAANFEDVR